MQMGITLQNERAGRHEEEDIMRMGVCGSQRELDPHGRAGCNKRKDTSPDETGEKQMKTDTGKVADPVIRK